ncbi:MAG: PadR family transcriptional regulator [Kiloniellales bacterium]
MDAKTLCLAVLARGDASGYEIKKALEEAPFSHFQETGFGSIYPALNRLTAEGQASCTEMAQDKRPDKKVYAITESGRAGLVEALMEPPAPDRFRSDFLFILYHGGMLPASYLAGVIDARIAFYDEKIERMRGCDVAHAPGAQRFVHGYGLAVYQAAADYLRQNREALLASAAADPRQVAE